MGVVMILPFIKPTSLANTPCSREPLGYLQLYDTFTALYCFVWHLFSTRHLQVEGHGRQACWKPKSAAERAFPPESTFPAILVSRLNFILNRSTHSRLTLSVFHLSVCLTLLALMASTHFPVSFSTFSLENYDLISLVENCHWFTYLGQSSRSHRSLSESSLSKNFT